MKDWYVNAVGNPGTWRFQVLFNGQTYEQPFQMCGNVPLAPLPLSPANGAVVKAKPALDWNDTDCANTYNLVVRKGSKKGPVVMEKTGLWDSTVKAKKVTAPGVYYWRVTAWNEFGSTNSPWRHFTVSP